MKNSALSLVFFILRAVESAALELTAERRMLSWDPRYPGYPRYPVILDETLLWRGTRGRVGTNIFKTISPYSVQRSAIQIGTRLKVMQTDGDILGYIIGRRLRYYKQTPGNVSLE